MKHAIITGGEGDLGKSIARVFAGADWQVDAPGRLELDVTNAGSVSRYFHHRPVDLLVCNAGITKDSPMSRMSEQAWDEVMAVNFYGARFCAHAVLHRMKQQRHGHIVFISSYSALHPPMGQAAYAAAKAALLGLTRDLAVEHGSSNIRVNAVLPGFLETKMTASLSQARLEQVAASHSLDRFNTVSEVSGFIRFLHEGLPHTSGQIFQLDSR